MILHWIQLKERMLPGWFRPPRPPQRNGYTLTELVVGMTVSSMVMLAVTHTLFVASSISEDNDNRFKDVCDGGGGLGQLSRELTTAISVTSYTARSITFTVPDRDSDSNPETISYTWSGTPNDPLIRTENAGSPTTYARIVQDFDMQYATGTSTRTEKVTVPSTTTDLGVIFNFEGWSSVIPLPLPLFSSLTDSYWQTEYFQIPDGVLPGDADTLEIYKVAIYAAWLTNLGTYTVGVHHAESGRVEPQVSPIGTPAVLTASSLSVLPSWVDATFSDVQIVKPSVNKNLVVVLKGSAGLGTLKAFYLYSTAAPSDTPVMLWTSNGGGTWSPNGGQRSRYDMYVRVYGRVKTKETEQTQTITDTHLRRVFVSLRNGAASATRHVCTVRTLNRPVLSSS